MNIVCQGCRRSVTPSARVERDKKKGVNYKITYCPYERCGFNMDIEKTNLQLWDNELMKFQDFKP